MSVNMSVLIPVKFSGYTGQREEYEEYENDMKVSISGGVVTLSDTQSYRRPDITFSVDDLTEALNVVGLKQPNIPRFVGDDSR